jgi:hypothetical protein
MHGDDGLKVKTKKQKICRYRWISKAPTPNNCNLILVEHSNATTCVVSIGPYFVDSHISLTVFSKSSDFSFIH